MSFANPFSKILSTIKWDTFGRCILQELFPLFSGPLPVAHKQDEAQTRNDNIFTQKLDKCNEGLKEIFDHLSIANTALAS